MKVPAVGKSSGRGSGGGQSDVGGGPEVPFEVNDEPTLMIRSLDFTVDPGQTYRYPPADRLP